jgi:hypothetical protein
MKHSNHPAAKKPFGRIAAVALGLLALTGITAQPAAADDDNVSFDMVRNAALAAAPNCVPNAKAHVSIEPGDSAERMTVKLEGLPPNTDFDFFVIQVPHAPFGMAWYQGDIETNAAGKGRAEFVGRFNIETFIVAPGTAPAPSVFSGPFPDATLNPATNPIHTYHLGLWFNSPQDAVKAGCPGTITPFNGEHNAGIQILNTSNFPDLKGPLFQIH